MTPTDAMGFAQEWVDAWNRRDIDGVLEAWADDAVFVSERAGMVVSKQAIREYWRKALTPGLTMKLMNVLPGRCGLVILYMNHLGRLCSEVLEFDDAGLVVRGAAYAEVWPT